MSHMEVRAVSAVAEDSETRRRDQVARHVDDERIATLFELTPTPLIAGLAFAILVAVILWPYRGGMVGGWLLLKFMVGAMRLADVRRFRRVRGRHDEMPRWRRRAARPASSRCCACASKMRSSPTSATGPCCSRSIPARPRHASSPP